MRKIIMVSAMLFVAIAMQAQEKVMNIIKTDGTHTETRVADLKQISFLTTEAGNQGLLVKTTGGETVGVLFETNPVVTIANGKLVIKSNAAEAVEFEITDIAEISFGAVSGDAAISAVRGFDFVLQEGGAVLRGIPAGVKANVYSVDGRSLPTPPLTNGELRLSRETLGTGIFVVKVGTFSTKIKL